MLDCEKVTLYQVDSIKNELVCKFSDGVTGWRVPIGKGLAGECALTGKILNIKDCYLDHRFNQARDRETGYRTKSMICMPIHDTLGNVVAVVQAINKRSGFFNKIDEDLFQAIANQSGITLQRAELFEQESKIKLRTSALLSVAREVSRPAADNFNEIIHNLTEIIKNFLCCDRVSLFQIDTVNHEFVLHVSNDAPNIRMKLNQGIVGNVAGTGEIVNIIDVYKDPRFNQDVDKKTSYKTRTMLCVPIRDKRQRIVAVLQAINKRCHECGSFACPSHGVEFDSDDSNAAKAFAQEMGSMFQKRQYDTAFSKIFDDPTIDLGMKNFIGEYYHTKRETILEDNLAMMEEFSSLPKQLPSLVSISESMEEELDQDKAVHANLAIDPSLISPVNLSSPVATLNTPLANKRLSIVNFSALPSSKVLSPLGKSKSTSFSFSRPSVESFANSLIGKYRKQNGAFGASELDFTNVNWIQLTNPIGFNFSKEDFFSFDFDYFANCSATQFPNLILLMFHEFNLLSQFKIDPKKILNFVALLEKHHNLNPYHNFLHAFSVLHATFVLCQNGSISAVLSSVDIFSLMIAALTHDVEHPGMFFAEL